MRIHVVAFGQLRSLIKQELSFQDMKDTDDLKEKLEEIFPGLSKLNYVMAVNKEIIRGKTSLSDESIVALLPPYSGG
ncbi:MAG TPA: MoaD/ThiS family protein [Ferruginibacter sp.]|nr:MoaD/ThiS family protein [Ferruginibacter sp.]